MLSTGVETGVCFHRGPALGNKERMFFSQGLRKKGEIFLSGGLLLRNLRGT